tara:strand:- start:70 stop:435 length:366 start_codon:yes stop_codon:yes gene_type:complete
MYKKAAKQKLRFISERGNVTTEQLFDLTVEELDCIAVKLQEEYSTSGKKSFLLTKSVKNRAIKLRFDIVIDVLNTKLEQAEKASNLAQSKAHNNKIDMLIAEKQDDNLKSMSIKELQNQKL